MCSNHLYVPSAECQYPDAQNGHQACEVMPQSQHISIVHCRLQKHIAWNTVRFSCTYRQHLFCVQVTSQTAPAVAHMSFESRSSKAPANQTCILSGLLQVGNLLRRCLRCYSWIIYLFSSDDLSNYPSLSLADRSASTCSSCFSISYL